MKQNPLPIADKVSVLEKSYISLQAFVESRIFGFTVYTDEKAKKIKREIADRINRQNKICTAWVALYIPIAYNQAAERSKKRLEKIKETPRLKKFDEASKKTKTKFSKETLAYMTAANKKILNTVNKFFKLYKKSYKTVGMQNFQLQNLTAISEINEGVDKIAKASIVPTSRVTKTGFTYLATPSRGEVQKQIKGLFQKTFGDFDFIQVPLKNGGVRNYKPTGYIKMVARSEMRMAQTAATKDRCKQYQCDLLQCSTHDDPCPLCQPFEGQIRSISGNHPFYPPLRDEAPFHPNCEHNENPINDAAIEFEKKRGAYFPPINRDLTVAGRLEELKALRKRLPAKTTPTPTPKKKLTTKAEIEKYVYDMGIVDYDFTDINDLKSLREIASQLETLIKTEKYKLNLQSLHAYFNGAYAKGGTGIIKINGKYFDDYKKLLKTAKTDAARGFHPNIPESDLIRAIITHESAHVMTYEEIYYKEGLYPKFKKIKEKYIEEMLSAKDKAAKSKAFISEYANTDLDEFVAEAFTDYKHSQNPSPYSIEVGKLIDAKYKKGGVK